MLKAMLAAARDVIDLDLPGKNQSLADCFLEVIRQQDQWLMATRRFRDLDDLALGLPGDNHSAVGPLSPSLALAYQARIGSELAVELVQERGRRLPFPLITRGTDGGRLLGPRTLPQAIPRLSGLALFPYPSEPME